MTIARIPIGGALPAGKYWQDITADKLFAWQQWLDRNKGAVVVTATEQREGDNSPDLTFYAFTVKTPVQWHGPGYPTIVPAGSTVTSADDVVQKPSAEDLGYKDPSKALVSAAETGIAVGVGALIVLGGIILLGKARRK